MADYPRNDLLVETDWLAEHLTDPNVRVIEMAEDGSSFEAGHIPGAALSPTWQVKGSEQRRLVAPPDEAKAWFESVGIGDDTLVVGYDRFRSRDASRLWWVLNYYGHTNVRVLNGGWTKWTAEGREVEDRPVAGCRRRRHVHTVAEPRHRVDRRQAQGRHRHPRHRHLGRADGGRVHGRELARQRAGRARAGRRVPGVGEPRGGGRHVQVRGGDRGDRPGPRHHAGEDGPRLLTGRSACVARHGRAQAHRPRVRLYVRRLDGRVGEPRRHSPLEV